MNTDCILCRHRGQHEGLCVNVPEPERPRRLSVRRRGDLSRELKEFFLHEPGAVSSNYGGIAARALSGVRTSGGNAFGDDVAIARMHRIHRAVGWHEAIRRACLALEDRHQLTLWLAFGPHRLPPEWRKALGYNAAAALLTDAAKDACRHASGAAGEPTPAQLGAWLTRACAKNGKDIVAVIAERDRHVEEALVAYAGARATQKKERDEGESASKLKGGGPSHARGRAKREEDDEWTRYGL